MTDVEARRMLGLPIGIQLHPDVIRRAWKEAALRTHPDRGGTPEVFVVVSQAAQVLRDLDGVPSAQVSSRTHQSSPAVHRSLRMISGPPPNIPPPSFVDPYYDERQRVLESMYGRLSYWGRSGDGLLHLWNSLYRKRRKE